MKFLTFKHGKLVLETGLFEETPITSLDAFFAAAAGENVWRSSSVDFPEEYTTDPDVLALVAAILALPMADDPRVCRDCGRKIDEPGDPTPCACPVDNA